MRVSLAYNDGEFEQDNEIFIFLVLEWTEHLLFFLIPGTACASLEPPTPPTAECTASPTCQS